MADLTSTALQQRLNDFTLPDHARVWMYTANRILTDAECAAMDRSLATFRTSWAAHGQPLQSQSVLLLNQVLVLAVDESSQAATGCSIDASVAAVRGLNQAAPTLSDLDLLDRSWVVFLANGQAAEWSRARLHDFWARCKAGTLDGQAQILDTTLTSLGALRTEGVKPLADSWHAHMW